MRIMLMLLAFGLAGGFLELGSLPETNRFSLMFWNVENFFAPGEFEGHSWSRGRFYTKCHAVAKTILLAGDELCGEVPDIVAFAEVGSREVMTALVGATPLRKLDYGIVHYDSPDRRGIDCALLYRRSRFHLLSSKPCHLYTPDSLLMTTRDILLVVLEPLQDARSGPGMTRGECVSPDLIGGLGPAAPIAVLVNHHPSKVGSGSAERREIAMSRLRFLVDSLKAEGISRIVAVGDFNDTVVPAPGIIAQACMAAASWRACPPPERHPKNQQISGGPVMGRGTGPAGYKLSRSDDEGDGGRGRSERSERSPARGSSQQAPGTIKFQGKWEKIDGTPILEGMTGTEVIFAPPHLSEKDSYGGEKPRRTFLGPRYNAGISDHYPVVLLLSD